MFRSFFPMPKVFFGSAAVWAAICIFLWYSLGTQIQGLISLDPILTPDAGDNPSPFLSNQKVWLYQFIILASYGFCIPWFFVGRNKWYWWSVVGSVTIVLILYAIVQVGAWVNDWYGITFNLMQSAMSEPGSVKVEQLYDQFWSVIFVLVPNISVAVFLSFYTSHYVFRWRTAMTFYYMEHWPSVRTTEGASQRIQEDTSRFAAGVEDLGTTFINSLMTLAVFLPILWDLSHQVKELPLVGEVTGSLIWVAIISAAFGTVLLAAVGVKLPGLEFKNQQVEAAFRKELVYGEDHEDRAAPLSVSELFGQVRKNYYTLYFHYLYFNVARWAYIQGAAFVPLVALAPSMASGAITFGVYRQVANAFDRVENSFQFLANSWTGIIRLISVYQRLRKFEAAIPR